MTMIDETQENRLREIHQMARIYLQDIAGGRFLAADRFLMLNDWENNGATLCWSRADLEAFEGRMAQMVDYALRHRQPAYWAAGGYLADGSRGMSEVRERCRAERLEALAKGLWVTPKLAEEYRAQQEGSGEAAVEPGTAPALAQPQTEGKFEVGDVVRWLGEEHEVTCASPRSYPDHVKLSGKYVVQSKNLALVRRAEPQAAESVGKDGSVKAAVLVSCKCCGAGYRTTAAKAETMRGVYCSQECCDAENAHVSAELERSGKGEPKAERVPLVDNQPSAESRLTKEELADKLDAALEHQRELNAKHAAPKPGHCATCHERKAEFGVVCGPCFAEGRANGRLLPERKRRPSLARAPHAAFCDSPETDRIIGVKQEAKDISTNRHADLLRSLAREQQPRRVVAHPHPGRNFALTKRWEEP